MEEFLSFEEAVSLFHRAEHAPFLRSLTEEAENQLHLLICPSKLCETGENPNCDLHIPAGSQLCDPLQRILEQCRSIVPDEAFQYEIVFENYILYQVRNESFCSYDDHEIRTGNYLIVFEKSRLLDYLSVATDACKWKDGTFYPGQWRHFGIYTQNHVIDVISHCPPKVYASIGPK